MICVVVYVKEDLKAIDIGPRTKADLLTRISKVTISQPSSCTATLPDVDLFSIR